MVAGTDKSETVFVSGTAQHQSQPPAWVSLQALGMQLLQPGSSWSLSFITTSVGVFTGAGVTGRLQCRDKSLNESEPLTGEHYLFFPGRTIRRKSLEESRVSEFAADFPVPHQRVAQPRINTHFCGHEEHSPPTSTASWGLSSWVAKEFCGISTQWFLFP